MLYIYIYIYIYSVVCVLFFVFTFWDFYIWIVASNMGCENSVFLEIDPFLFYLAAPLLILGHFQRDNLTHLIVMTAFCYDVSIRASPGTF